MSELAIVDRDTTPREPVADHRTGDGGEGHLDQRRSTAPQGRAPQQVDEVEADPDGDETAMRALRACNRQSLNS